MGNLTDDMTRLRGEVDALRSDRGALIQELARGASDLATTVSAMQTGFADARVAMAKKTRKEREAFVASVIREVHSLLGAFSRDRNDMARKDKTDRGDFLTEMKRQVTDLRKEMADDLTGVRLAWSGPRLGKSRPIQMKKKTEIVKTALSPVGKTVKKVLPKSKGEIRLDKKPAKAATKVKGGRK